MNERLDLIGGEEQFMQPHAAFVASLATDMTPLPTKQPKVVIIAKAELGKRGFAITMRERLIFFFVWMIRFLAIAAEGLCQSLRQDAQKGIGEQKRVHLHLQEPGDSFDRTIGV